MESAKYVQYFSWQQKMDFNIGSQNYYSIM